MVVPSEKPKETPPEVPRPRVRRLNIIGRRNIFFLISLLIIIPGILSMAFKGFLLGIDFAGGTEFTITFASQPSVASVENAVAADPLTAGGTVIQTGGGGGYIIRSLPLTPQQQQIVEDHLVSRLGPMVGGAPQQVIEVGGTIARETIEFALL